VCARAGIVDRQNAASQRSQGVLVFHVEVIAVERRPAVRGRPLEKNLPVTILIPIVGKILHLSALLGDAPVKTVGPDASDVAEGSLAVFPFLGQSEGPHHMTGPLDLIGVGANQE